jgi:hypothetical protein
MSLQEIGERERPHKPRSVWNLYQAVAGCPRIVTGLSASTRKIVTGFDWSSSNATTGISLGGEYYVGASDYDPDFVASILQADSAPPEASFNNVVDMLDWLNRD